MKPQITTVRKNSMSWIQKLLPLLALLLISCGGNRTAQSPEEVEDYEQLGELMNNRNFEIENQWALPQGGSRVNIIQNPNFIRFSGDSVNVHLPYFGVRHSGGGYGSEGGIRYEGLMNNLEIEENRNKNSMTLRFQGEQGAENLRFDVSIYPNGRTTTGVTSSQRNSISYQGQVRK